MRSLTKNEAIQGSNKEKKFYLFFIKKKYQISKSIKTMNTKTIRELSDIIGG